MMMNRVAFFSAILLLSGMLTACTDGQNQAKSNTPEHVSQNANTITTQFPKSPLTASTILDSIKDTPSVRGETVTDHGTLLMVSEGREELGHLAVSSNLGLEGDKTFQSNYAIVYKQGEEEKTLLELPSLMFARPNDRKLTFNQLSFKNAEVYVLMPQYKTGHGVEGYVFAIDKKSGEASRLKISDEGSTSDTLVYSEMERFPHVENDLLVVSPPMGAGGETEAEEKQYRLDLANKTLVAVKSSDTLKDKENQVEFFLTDPDRRLKLYNANTTYKADDFYKGFILEVDGTPHYFDWEVLSMYADETQVLHTDVTGDGIEEAVVIMTWGRGTEMAIQEVHVVDTETFEEIKVADPVEILDNEVASSIAMQGETAKISVNVQGMEDVVLTDDVTPGFVNNRVGYGGIIYYQVKDGKLTARLGANISVIKFIGDFHITYRFEQNELRADHIEFEEVAEKKGN